MHKAAPAKVLSVAVTLGWHTARMSKQSGSEALTVTSENMAACFSHSSEQRFPSVARYLLLVQPAGSGGTWINRSEDYLVLLRKQNSSRE